MDTLQSMLDRTTEERNYLDRRLKQNPLLLFVIGQKASGKGTRTKLLQKALPGHFEHVAVGDLARELQKRLQDEGVEKIAEELVDHLPSNLSPEQINDLLEPFIELEGSKLKSTEVILSLVKKALSEMPEKSIILDGFPRSPEQIEHALNLIDHFEQEGYNPLFVDIETPYEVRDMRMKGRRVCPECANSKNLLLWPSDLAEYDPETNEVYMLCDNDGCERVRLVEKDYDAEGAEAMAERDQITQNMVDHLKEHHGHRTVSISNAIPVHQAHQYEPHDITEVTRFAWDPEKQEVTKKNEPWVIKDTEGNDAYSGYPETWVVDFLKELHQRYQNQER